MRSTAIVVDGFYDDPDAVREIALASDYFNPYERPSSPESAHGYHPRLDCWFTSHEAYATEENLQKLERILGIDIDLDHWFASMAGDTDFERGWNTRFQSNQCVAPCRAHVPGSRTANMGLHRHCADNPKVQFVGEDGWAGVVFLTPEAPLERGLLLGDGDAAEHPPDLMFLREQGFITDVIGNRYNRLVLVPGTVFHSGTPGWTRRLETGRLIQTFFFRPRPAQLRIAGPGTLRPAPAPETAGPPLPPARLEPPAPPPAQPTEPADSRPRMGTTWETAYQVERGDVREFSYEPIRPHANFAPWLRDAAFAEVFARVTSGRGLVADWSEESRTWVDQYRLFELWGLVEQVAPLEGSLLEVGVAKGGSGALLATRARMCGIADPIWLCDTFCGVAKVSAQDATYRGGEHAVTTRADVDRFIHETMGLDPGVRILEGIFPDETARLIPDRRFRFAHIDVDVYLSARHTTEWIWERLVVGGILVFDDYGFHTCDGVTRWVEEQRTYPDRHVVYNLNGHGLVFKIR